MQEQQGNEQIAKLLQELERAGAQVSEGENERSALTGDALAKVASRPEFAAWVSWTKSF